MYGSEIPEVCRGLLMVLAVVTLTAFLEAPESTWIVMGSFSAFAGVMFAFELASGRSNKMLLGGWAVMFWFNLVAAADYLSSTSFTQWLLTALGVLVIISGVVLIGDGVAGFVTRGQKE